MTLTGSPAPGLCEQPLPGFSCLFDHLGSQERKLVALVRIPSGSDLRIPLRITLKSAAVFEAGKEKQVPFIERTVLDGPGFRAVFLL